MQPLEIAGHAIEAHSVGGIETCIAFPRLKLAFDIGRAPRASIGRETVLFTHAHMDHMGGVAYHCATRALLGMRPPTYVVGPENAQAFAELFEVWRRLDHSELPHSLVVLGPGKEYQLQNKLYARPFRSPHRAPCQGYGLWSRRMRLLEALRGLPPAELGARRARGETLERVEEHLELAFTGDCLIEALDRNPELYQARLLVMEVTFLDERVSVEQSRSKGHVHLDEVVERAERFQNQALLLTHFSSRYRAEEIRRILDARVPEALRQRITPLTGGHA